jgi:lysyl-tRNA synthetase class II
MTAETTVQVKDFILVVRSVQPCTPMGETETGHMKRRKRFADLIIQEASSLPTQRSMIAYPKGNTAKMTRWVRVNMGAKI